MKRFVFLLALLAIWGGIILFANDLLCRHLSLSCINSPMYKIYRLFCEHHDGELPILGSSRAEYGYVPSMLSTNAFNYGMEACWQYETVQLAQVLCAKSESKVILVNLDPWGLENGGRYGGNYSLVCFTDLFKSLSRPPSLAWNTRIVGLRFFGQFRSSFARCLNSCSSVSKTVESGAILQKRLKSEDQWRMMISQIQPRKFTVNDETIQEYEKLIVRHPSIRFVFVIAPVSREWWECLEGGQDLDRLISRLAKNENVDVLDLCRPNLADYDHSCFIDPTHLSEHGARLFSKRLKARLQRLKVEL